MGMRAVWVGLVSMAVLAACAEGVKDDRQGRDDDDGDDGGNGAANGNGGGGGSGATGGDGGSGAATGGSGGCAPGLEDCGGECVDTMTSAAHCGGCNLPCQLSEECLAGECGPLCEGVFIACNGMCVDSSSDEQHCGDCITVCAPNEICNGGTCELDCPPPQQACNNQCVDVLTNEQHCGSCNAPCAPNETCSQGNCVAPGMCGNSIVDANEEYDPPPGPFLSAPVLPQTCRWDFTGVQQLYCNGSCSWAGGQDCDQADADIFCKLKTDNPNSVATSFGTTTALAQPGFPCAPLNYGTPLGPMPSRGVNVNVAYQDSSILADHGSGNVIVNVVCTP
jgi:hypothetical protein